MPEDKKPGASDEGLHLAIALLRTHMQISGHNTIVISYDPSLPVRWYQDDPGFSWGPAAEFHAERRAQDEEWGGSEHDDTHDNWAWVAFIAKHLGRAVTPNLATFRKAMVRVGALAWAAIEWADRCMAAQRGADR